MAICGGERQKRAGRMIDRDEGGIGDEIVGLRSAIIGVGAPGNVRQEARGVPESPVFLVFVQVRGRKQPVGPFEKLLPVRGRARAQAIELAGRDDQRILFLNLPGKLREEKAFANAERRNDDLFRIGQPDDFLEHRGAIGEKRTARGRDGLDRHQRVDLDALDEPCELEGVARRDHVIVHDVHRVLSLAHMQPRQRAPRPADGVERAPGRDCSSLTFDSASRTIFAAFFGDRSERSISERPPSGRVNPAPASPSPTSVNFERSAAQIADDSVRLVNRADDPERRESGFLLAAEQLDLAADGALRECEKLRSVRGVAHRGGRDAANVADPHGVAKNAKPLKRGERLGDAVFGQEPGWWRRPSPARTAPFR